MMVVVDGHLRKLVEIGIQGGRLEGLGRQRRTGQGAAVEGHVNAGILETRADYPVFNVVEGAPLTGYGIVDLPKEAKISPLRVLHAL